MLERCRNRSWRWARAALLTLATIPMSLPANAQHSVARQWNDLLLEAIRRDNARPTVHARNLFHISAAMYDAWAAYGSTGNTWLLNQAHRGFFTPFSDVPMPEDNLKAAREEAISYAAYRIIRHRFASSPGAAVTITAAENLMDELGYDRSISSMDYADGTPAHLGNYIAESMIQFGMQDGSNEEQDYGNNFYEPVNEPLVPVNPGNPTITDFNRWQPLSFDEFIDQSGNVIPVEVPEFLSPEWGSVVPFSLEPEDLIIHEKEGQEYWVYHDPGPPPYLQEDGEGLSDEYQWGFALVSIWSAHLDPNDGIMWDISPASLGNIDVFPATVEGYRDFYKQLEGGDPGTGYTTNPVTGEPYEPQVVPRGDYGRVLAEFWADGPDSETPPGHWFTILNYVNDHPLFEKRYRGTGPVMDDLEWDIKSYFILGGAMHDSAISAWGIKGYYDYIRPISAIRGMADKGQSSDPALENYSEMGIPLVEGYIEVVDTGDPLAGAENEHVGKIKLKAWKGHPYIADPETEYAGVDWILAEDWWPYQRPTFVTPPFAGYISGHSTFSRAAAEVMTIITGDPYFPGGMGEFFAARNEFLVFEEGPSVDLTLQWATYRDASDQTSLSRIWGGIHPPADDIPGRLIGETIGIEAVDHAEKYFEGLITGLGTEFPEVSDLKFYPNPVTPGQKFHIQNLNVSDGDTFELYGSHGQKLWSTKLLENTLQLPSYLSTGLYLITIQGEDYLLTGKLIIK